MNVSDVKMSDENRFSCFFRVSLRDEFEASVSPSEFVFLPFLFFFF